MINSWDAKTAIDRIKNPKQTRQSIEAISRGHFYHHFNLESTLAINMLTDLTNLKLASLSFYPSLRTRNKEEMLSLRFI